MRLLLIIPLLFSISVDAEIHKEAIPTEHGLEFRWWPVLPEIEGWHQDRNSSLKFGMNAQAPIGSTFENAETVIYSRAVYKPRVPNIKNLSAFIENDKADFLAKESSLKISRVDPIRNSDEVLLQSFSFTPSSTGNWEQVSYLEEEKFYIVFTISSRSKRGFKESFSAYKQIVEEYKKEL